MAVVLLRNDSRKLGTRPGHGMVGCSDSREAQVVSFPADYFAQQLTGGEHRLHLFPPEALGGGLIPPGGNQLGTRKAAVGNASG